jgi:cytochrome P450
MSTNSDLIDPNDLMLPTHYGDRGIPHKAWTTLREQSPVHWCETDNRQPFWAITKHADIMDISGKPDRFSSAKDGIVILNRDQMLSRTDTNNPLATFRTIIEMDPPEHRNFRKVASGFFTPRSITSLDEIVAESARKLIDSLGEEGECDLIDKIATRHPLRVLATILGINEEDEDRLLELTQQLFAGDDPDLQRKGEDRQAALAEVGMEFFQLFDRIIQDRRANPRDDLATLLATAKLADGTEMGPMETFGYYLIVFTAGHDTTRNALSGGFEAMMENPEALQTLKGHPELAKSAVEEVIRWASPVNYMKRTVMQDTELRGQKMKEGDALVLFYASANRDAEVFDDPFKFDITRHPNRHLGFGTGEHFCMGAHVARMSAKALLEEMANRIEVLEPAGPSSMIESSFVVGLKTLPVRYKIKPAA